MTVAQVRLPASALAGSVVRRLAGRTILLASHRWRLVVGYRSSFTAQCKGFRRVWHRCDRSRFSSFIRPYSQRANFWCRWLTHRLHEISQATCNFTSFIDITLFFKQSHASVLALFISIAATHHSTSLKSSTLNFTTHCPHQYNLSLPSRDCSEKEKGFVLVGWPI